MYFKVFFYLVAVAITSEAAASPPVPHDSLAGVIVGDHVDSQSSLNEAPSRKEYPFDRLSDQDLLILNSRDSSYWQAEDQDTLKQVLFFHRHADRSPIQFAPRDNIARESFWQLHGWGQLTNRGKARLYALGKIIRQRYNIFLRRSVNKNMRRSQSSGSLRCIESAQLFLASFLSTDDPNSPDAQSMKWAHEPDNLLGQIWQPASVNTFGARYDGLLNMGSECKSVDLEFARLDKSRTAKYLSKEYKHERDVLRREIGFEISHFYHWFYASNLLDVELSYFPEKVKPALVAIHDRLQEAGSIAVVLQQLTFKLKRLRAGLLINDMINSMTEIRDSIPSESSKRFVHYCGHDTNLAFLLGLFDNLETLRSSSGFGANIVLELHQDGADWFVKIFYMRHVPSKPVELVFEACSKDDERRRCKLDKFEELMQKYRVSSWSEWMRECGNSFENINPYEQSS